MAAITDSPVVKGLQFHYDPSPQHSPQWLACKRGRIGASSVWKWLAVSKRPNKEGVHTPLKARTDYELELQFERQFNTNFEHYTNSAMQEGNEFEDWVARQYEAEIGVVLEKVGCWYNEFMCISPDRRIKDQNAGVEIKLLKDNSFTEVMANVNLLRENDRMALEDNTSSVHKHWKQMQSQMWATGWDYIDYVPLNMNSRKFATIRVTRDEDFIAELKEKVQEPVTAVKFPTGAIHNVIGEVPTGLIMPNDPGESNEVSWL